MNISCHLRCAKLLSGTEAFCIYLRLLGAKIGKHCSIRAINPVSNPELMSIGAGVHLGDFSKIITGFHSSNGYTCGKIEVQDNSVIGSQSLILPGSLIQKNVILGALSLAPMNSILQEGGLYIGSQSHTTNLTAPLHKQDSQKVTLTLTRTWYQTFTSLFIQPFLQTASPHILLGLSIYLPLNLIFHLKNTKKVPIFWLHPLFWILSGIIAALTCVIAKWVIIGRKKKGEKIPIWSKSIIFDSTWQAIRTLIGDYFMEMTCGSFMFVIWMKMMGVDVNIDNDDDVYVDSMGTLLNPEMVKIERGGCVGKEALFFGHIYEGDEGGMVKFGEIKIGENGFVGSRAVVMPGVVLENEANVGALSLVMKEEIVRSR
jgi:acetyltransferase-like isoleucine patch superfamily enzyme